MTTHWDVFHSERLEVERGVATEVVLAKLAAGALNGDDLIRPAGTTRWNRINQVAELEVPEEPISVQQSAPVESPPEPASITDALVEPEFPDEAGDTTAEFPTARLNDPAATQPKPELEPEFASGTGFAFEPTDDEVLVFRDDSTPVLPDDEAGRTGPAELGDPLASDFEATDDLEEDPAAEFTLSRNSTESVEELDLAAMVDVAFQLVLFFLVTASTLVYKTLEVPKPNEDKPPEAAAQSRAKSIDELEKDYILVEVDAEGAVKVDHLPVPPDRATLVEKLRAARESTGRKAMLLSADFATRHRNAVLAFDVASEIDLQIAIAQPPGKN